LKAQHFGIRTESVGKKNTDFSPLMRRDFKLTGSSVFRPGGCTFAARPFRGSFGLTVNLSKSFNNPLKTSLSGLTGENRFQYRKERPSTENTFST
jgi:hypothetical protein